jgi:peptidoglycan/xylan/chitin deacetylase (PgdA/CDA1 family)
VTTVCLTFDHLGSAQRIGQGALNRPDPEDAGATIGYPRILRLLDELDVRGSFFVEGWSLLHYPNQIAQLLERGHEVALHGWVHERWSQLPAGEQERLLSDGLAALQLSGVRVAGFRAPHGYLAPETPGLLAELGFAFDSSLLGPSDAPPQRPRPLGGGLVNVPFSWPMVDAWQYKIRPDVLTPAQLAQAWLELAVPNGPDEPQRVVTLVAHPHLSGVATDAFTAFEDVVRVLAADPRVRLRRVGDVASEGWPAAA